MENGPVVHILGHLNVTANPRQTSDKIFFAYFRTQMFGVKTMLHKSDISTY